jgi:crossover junction endodeoxyribonuclease RuvC
MVIGVDPGTNIVGYALVEGNRANPVIVDFGIIHTAPRPQNENPQRLLEIAIDFECILDQYKPDKAIVEDLFFFRNVTTIIPVAQSRGVLLYQLIKRGIEIDSLTPLQIKLGVCGYGKATKKQVQTMVQKIYKLDELPKPDDAADALAIAWLGLKG